MTFKFKTVWQRLRSKQYREQLVAEQAKRSIPFQIQAMLKKRGMTQTDLAERAGLTQGVVSRAANLDYGNLTLNTVVRVAAGFDVAFVGEFVPFSKLVDHFDRTRSLGDVATFEQEDEAVESDAFSATGVDETVSGAEPRETDPAFTDTEFVGLDEEAALFVRRLKADLQDTHSQYGPQSPIDNRVLANEDMVPA